MSGNTLVHYSLHLTDVPILQYVYRTYLLHIVLGREANNIYTIHHHTTTTLLICHALIIPPPQYISHPSTELMSQIYINITQTTVNTFLIIFCCINISLIYNTDTHTRRDLPYNTKTHTTK